MILTTPCTHPYFLNFIRTEIKDMPSNLYPEENGLPLAFLYMENGEVLGCAMLISAYMRSFIYTDYIENDSPWVIALFVAPNERNRHIGQTIMNSMIEYTHTHEYSDIYFNTETARRFYEKNWQLHYLGEGLVHEPDEDIASVPSEYFRLNIEENLTNFFPKRFTIDEYFFNSCENNDLATMKKLGENSSINLKMVNEHNENAIILAIKNNNLEMLQYLVSIAQPEDIHYQNKTKANALLYACAFGNVDIVHYLLTSEELNTKFDIHYQDNDGKNGLMFACMYGHLDVADYLLSSPKLTEHINLLATDKQGLSALYWALIHNSIDTCALAEKLIVNYDMPIDANSLTHLKQSQSKLLDTIRTRDLHHKIEHDLPKSSHQVIKRKI